MTEPARRIVSPDDSLPPVEPPSAAFLVQLFLVPALIVGIIVFVWLAFHWLAQLGNDPEGYVRALRRPSEGRWQAALNLANDLRGPGGGALKADASLAGDLAGILEAEVASGRSRAGGHGGEQSRTLCTYLCRALGEFAVPEAAPPLVARATDDSDPETARAAVEALAVLGTNLEATGGFGDPAGVIAALVAASQSDDARLRSAAAFALGVTGGDAAVERLGVLEADAVEDVRFNAAIGLARQGEARAYATLAEMLSLPDVPAAEVGDDAAQSRRYRRALVVVNALKGVGLLVDGGSPPPADVTAVLETLESDAVGDVRAAAGALARKLDRLSVRSP
jgi:HEAT repeat protein